MINITNTSLKYNKPTVQGDRVAYYLVTFTASFDQGTQFTGSTRIDSEQFESSTLGGIRKIVTSRIIDNLNTIK